MFRVERHRYGPRIYVAGRRVHEWHAGLAILVALATGALIRAWGVSTPIVLVGAIGAWLVVKDWRDVLPSKRDSGAWRVGIHRRALSLRTSRRADGLPAILGLATGAVGLVNIASALTPNIGWRGHVLLGLEPVEAVPVFHALTLPAGAALLLAAVYLVRRRQRACQVAIGFLAVAGMLNLLKGLDFEEAAASWALAGVLWWGRDAFRVRHETISWRSAIWRVPLLGVLASALGAIAVWASTSTPSHPSTGSVARETGDLLLWQSGPLDFHGVFAWLPLGVGLVSLAALVVGAYQVFRPLAGPGAAPAPDVRRAAAALVRTHGADTLAFFKLRQDKHYLFDDARRAFVGYRIENGVMLLSGDPVGPPEAIPDVVRAVFAYAEPRGLKVGAVGASAGLLALYETTGLRSFYIGDEAIVDVAGFSLQGRPIRKVRQSVHRLGKAGYEAELHGFAELAPAVLDELERISDRWRAGAPERGFSMAMDSLRGEHHDASAILLARDETGAIRGFLHFVPSYGRSAMSLSFMRRDRDTPNGLIEFLVVRALELLRERGVEELSLNFATFARLLHSPSCARERLLGRLVTLANPYFQIESLYRFNAKFFPRWEPRYLVYEGAMGLPRAGLAAMWAEGQLPKPGRRAAAEPEWLAA